ncbi:hypothetical protein AB1L42_14105, partial [Thalassoglobus sp. JC818]|uniref:hypothetical protein n=1 Tax=Thalassoglobus sp. JC818 TaxID=3232136 RepID=UPI003457B496
MAVADEKKKKSTKSSKYVDFDEFIDYQLKKTRSGIHQTDLLTSSVILLSFVLGYLLLFVIFDHWVIPGGFGEVTRMILSGAVLVASLSWLVVQILIPLWREVNVLYAAREIEEAYPELKSSLLSWVQLHGQSGREIPPDLMKALEKRTALQIKQSDVDEAVDRKTLMRGSYLLLGIVVLMCLYTIFSPKKLSTSVWRALFPTTSVAASTRTEILDVVPGDYEVLARDHLDVTTDLGGVIPEDVRLLFTTSDRRFVDEPVVMKNTGEGLPRFRVRLVGANGEGLLKDFTYRIEAGDATSDTYRVRINQPPTATVTSVEYDYPDYMLLEDTTQQSSTIDAWEGTFVTVSAQTNMPVTSARLYRTDFDSADETADFIEMVKTGDGELRARWRLKFREDGTFASNYFIQVTNDADQTDPQPTMHRIVIRPDEHPQITLTYPTQNELELPANAVIPIAFQANDPDFMLRRVVLRFEREGELLPVAPHLFDGPDRPEVKSRYDLDLSDFRLNAGDELFFFLEAEDNFEPFDSLPKHLTRTSKVRVRIIEPVPEEQVQQMQEQQEQQLENSMQDENGSTQENPQDQQPRDPQNEEESGEEGSKSEGGSTETETGESEQTEQGESNQGDQSSDGNSGQRNGDSAGSESSNTGQGEPTQSTEKSPPSDNADDRPSEEGGTETGGEGNQSDRSTGQQTGSQEQGGQNGSESEGRRQENRKRAEDDEALRELLKWSEENPQEPSSNEESPDQQAQPRDQQSTASEESTGETSESNQTSENQQSESRNDQTSADQGSQNDPMSGDSPSSNSGENQSSPEEQGTSTPSQETSPEPTNPAGQQNPSEQSPNSPSGTNTPDATQQTGRNEQQENGPDSANGAENASSESQSPQDGTPQDSMSEAGESNPEMNSGSPDTSQGENTSSDPSASEAGEKNQPGSAASDDQPAPNENSDPSKPGDEKGPANEKGNPAQENSPSTDTSNSESGQDGNPQETQNADMKSDGPGTESQPKEGDAPQEGQPSEGQPSEGQPSEGQPSEGQPSEGQPSE